jgi:hypothetical protein
LHEEKPTVNTSGPAVTEAEVAVAEELARAQGTINGLKLNLAAAESEVRHSAHVTWPTSLGPRHLAHVTWPTSLGPRHSAHVTWPTSLGPRHLAHVTWPTSLGPRHLAGSVVVAVPYLRVLTNATKLQHSIIVSDASP